jgi:uncharacterized protein with GYD domain
MTDERSNSMISFIIFGHFTQTGMAKVRNVTECILEMKVLLQGVGGKVNDVYYTLGTYDFVAFINAPDQNSMLKAMMDIAQLGTIRTETMVAVSADEVAELIKKE